MLRPLALLLAAVAACAASSNAGPALSARELPISRVVLYQNGVGYFERRGELAGDVLTLQVRPDQINDILKSLTVLDLNDGRAVSVSLPLEKRGADVLAELPEQVRNAAGLLQVLTAFRGARIGVDGDEGSRAGRIVGVEMVGDAARLTLKTDEGTLVVYPVQAIEEITLGDRTLIVGLDRSLDVSLDSGDWKPIALSVRLAGETPHELLVSYVAEMPVWKPTYRVVLGKQVQALVQGWAVVDNVSGDDWRDARLSLVAGNPVSFKYDLHSPQFTTRVDLTPQHRRTALAPVVERAGVAAEPPPPPAAGLAAPAPSAMPMPMEAPSMAPVKRSKKRPGREDEYDYAGKSAAEPDLGELMAAQAPPAASGETVGALFRYDLADPVTVPDGTSNLVSIVNAKVKGGQVVLFRGDGGNAYRAVRLTNATGSTLERGPVAIYDGSTFVGEAFVERMAPDTTAFLTYAQEGALYLTRRESSSEEGGRLLKITAGLIETEVQSVRKLTLTVKNDGKEAMTAYVKTPRYAGYNLRNEPQESVATPEAIFVPVRSEPGREATLELEWAQPVVRRIGIDTDASNAVLKLFLGSGKIPKAMAATIEEILRLKEKLVATRDESARLERVKRQLEGDQARVRANLDSLRKTRGNDELLATLAKKLGDIDGELSTHSAKLVRLSEEGAALESKMVQLIKGVTLEPSN